jgi:hypothetical protein
MKKLLSGLFVLALGSAVLAGCTESPTGTTGERPRERTPAASPGTSPRPGETTGGAPTTSPGSSPTSPGATSPGGSTSPGGTGTK